MLFNDTHFMTIDKLVDPDTDIVEYSTRVKLVLRFDSEIEREITDEFVAEHIYENLLNYIKQCSVYDIKTGMQFINGRKCND